MDGHAPAAKQCYASLMSPAISQLTIAESWEKRGFSCELWIDSPGQVWANFVHPVDELVMVVEGKVEFEFQGQVHLPKAGEELLIPAGAKHTVRNAGVGQSRWLYGYQRC